MADTNKITYVSLEKLGYYDQKLKAWVGAADEAVKSELKGLISAEETRAKAAELTNAQAAQAAQNAADAAQGEVDALETYVGTFTASEGVDTVVKYIDAKTANIASDATVNAIDDRVKAIEDDYLVEADKTELAGLITAEETRAKAAEDANAAAIKAIADDYLVEADKTELAGLITAEKERAMGIEGGLETRLAAVEADYLVEADKTELEGKIKTNTDAIAVLNGSVTEEGSVAKQVADAVAGILDGAPEAYDTLNEIALWIADHPDSVAAINADIKANADAIDALEALVGTLPEGETDVVAYVQKIVKAEEDRATGVEAGFETRIASLEGKFTGEDSVEDQISEALETAKGYTDTEVAALAEGAVADNAAAIEVLNGEGEGSVKKAVADAKAVIDADVDAVEAKADANAEAIAAINNETTGILAQAKKYADDEDAKIEERVGALETASATHALASDLTALTGRVTTVEGKVTTLEGEMDAVEALAAANKAAHEANAAAIALKADASALTAVSDRVTTLETWHANFAECETSDIDALFA